MTKIFATRDAKLDYCQNEMNEKDVNKTSFKTQDGLCRYNGMLFELKNTLATFQQAIDIIVAKVNWQQSHVLEGNAIICSKSQKNI